MSRRYVRTAPAWNKGLKCPQISSGKRKSYQLHPMQQHTKDKIALALTGKKLSADSVIKRSNSRRGKKYPKIGDALRGKTCPQRGRPGVPKSAQHAKRAADAKRGIPRQDMVGDNNHMRSLEARQRQSRMSKDAWSRGVFRNAKVGRGKAGFREDIGHFVRSSWEANFARILTQLGQDYKYEPRTFVLDTYSYRPDFYVHSKNVYVEIKGYVTPLALDKIAKTVKKYGVRIVLIDPEKYAWIASLYSKRIATWEF